MVEKYFVEQFHDNFNRFFERFCLNNSFQPKFVQLTTHSKLMSKKNVENINSLNKSVAIRLESLHNFDTQQQFTQVLREFYDMNLNIDYEKPKGRASTNVLIIQCDSSHFYQDLGNIIEFVKNFLLSN